MERFEGADHMIVAAPESPAYSIETPPAKPKQPPSWSPSQGAAGSSLNDDTRGLPLLSEEFGSGANATALGDAPPSAHKEWSGDNTAKSPAGQSALPLHYRDNWAAFVFVFHVVVVFCLAVTSQASFHKHGSNSSSSTSASQAGRIVSGVVLLLFLSGLVSWGWLKFLITYSRAVISCMLWTMTGALFFISIMYFVAGAVFAGLVFLFVSIFGFFYALGVQNRIPFASSNLRIACLGVAAHSPELVYVGLGAMLAVVIWVLMWAPAYLNVVGATPSGSFLLLSFRQAPLAPM